MCTSQWTFQLIRTEEEMGAQGNTHCCFPSVSGPTSRPPGLSLLHSVQWEKLSSSCHVGVFCKHSLERSQEACCGTGVVIKGDNSNKFPQNLLAWVPILVGQLGLHHLNCSLLTFLKVSSGAARLRYCLSYKRSLIVYGNGFCSQIA